MVRPRLAQGTFVGNRPLLDVANQVTGQRAPALDGTLFELPPNNSVDTAPADPSSMAIISAMQAISCLLASIDKTDSERSASPRHTSKPRNREKVSQTPAVRTSSNVRRSS
ncbi:unnamed protein product [Gordionus sp. m RMFG-2023]